MKTRTSLSLYIVKLQFPLNIPHLLQVGKRVRHHLLILGSLLFVPSSPTLLQLSDEQAFYDVDMPSANELELSSCPQILK